MTEGTWRTGGKGWDKGKGPGKEQTKGRRKALSHTVIVANEFMTHPGAGHSTQKSFFWKGPDILEDNYGV